MRTTRKATVEIRVWDRETGASGFVYSGDMQSRIGFSPLFTITHGAVTANEPIAIWGTNWGAPDKIDLPYMIDALRKAFPDREIECRAAD